jgi:translation initiation factor 2B subunit (eIF-2B alpha/beta/delta family)
MSNTGQMLEVLVSTQAKSIENLVETTTKLRDSLNQGSPLEASMTAIKDWFQKQEAITRDMAGAIKDVVIPDKSSTFVQEWLKVQENFGQQWFNTMKEMAQGVSSEKLLDMYKGSADKVFEVWKKAYDQFAGMFTTTFGLQNYDPAAQAKEMHDNFVEGARKYMTLLDEQIDKVKKSVSGQ